MYVEELDNEITELVPDEELEEEIRVDEYMEGVYEVLATINKSLGVGTVLPLVATPPTPRAELLSTTTPRTDPPASDRPATPTGTATGHDPPTAEAHLPGLPHFKGNLMRWTPFWDSFNSAVHQNPHLSEIDKFNYLRSLLKGAAYDAVAGLTLSAATMRRLLRY